MPNLRILVFLILAVLGCVTLIKGAPGHSSHRNEDLSKSENLSRRDNGNVSEPQKFCGKEPCGWAIFEVFSGGRRLIETAILNTCQCQNESFKCVVTDDDLELRSYIFRCLQNTTPKDIEFPKSEDY